MKIAAIILSAALLVACNASNNNPGESGAVNDGIKPVDQNGAMQDTGYNYTPETDTAKGEDRVDLQQRN
ncbi:hypothetical protein [Pseudocnuella soli]|uniref:hypothetical protein n=1 Tax=Pseudocnuella soli TaxID=2502779 RepID=UPI001050CA4E|nr:hypothetical protein [Pseudocnuella soli]